MADDSLITIQDACARAHVSRRTIYTWLAAGKVQYIRTAGGSIRIVAASLFRAGNVTLAEVVADAAPAGATR